MRRIANQTKLTKLHGAALCSRKVSVAQIEILQDCRTSYITKEKDSRPHPLATWHGENVCNDWLKLLGA